MFAFFGGGGWEAGGGTDEFLNIVCKFQYHISGESSLPEVLILRSWPEALEHC